MQSIFSYISFSFSGVEKNWAGVITECCVCVCYCLATEELDFSELVTHKTGSPNSLQEKKRKERKWNENAIHFLKPYPACCIFMYNLALNIHNITLKNKYKWASNPLHEEIKEEKNFFPLCHITMYTEQRCVGLPLLFFFGGFCTFFYCGNNSREKMLRWLRWKWQILGACALCVSIMQFLDEIKKTLGDMWINNRI